MRKDRFVSRSSKRILTNNVDTARGDDESSTMNYRLRPRPAMLQDHHPEMFHYLDRVHLPLLRYCDSLCPPATRRGATELRFPLSFDGNYGLGNFSAKICCGFTEVDMDASMDFSLPVATGVISYEFHLPASTHRQLPSPDKIGEPVRRSHGPTPR